MKAIPDNGKNELYNAMERVGNVRVDRFAIGYVDAKNAGDQKIFVRITGKANPEWLANAIQTVGPPGVQMERQKAPDGTPLILLRSRNTEPLIVFVGDTDLLVVGYLNPNAKSQDDVLAEVLEVRAKKKASAAAGKLKDRLAKIPNKAVAFALGDIPTELAGELGLKLGGGALVPTKFTAFMERSAPGLDVNVETALANANAADGLVRKIGELRKQGVEALKEEMKRPLPPGSPPVPFQDMINILDAIQVQSKMDRVQVRVSVPDAFIQRIGSMGALFFGVGEIR